jgi:polysaccharide pyruvyl transferase CsaB
VTEPRCRRIVLAGWYGAANLGDELILSVFIDWIREAGAEPVVISVNPHYTLACHRADAVGYTDLPAIVEALGGADLFVLGGGGLFQDYDAFDRASLAQFPAGNVSQFAQLFYLAGELDVPAAVLAQGVGPLRGADARAIAADVFDRASACSVRDLESAELLRDIGVRRTMPIAPDPAWSWATIEPIDPRARFVQLAGSSVLGIVVREWPFDRSWEAPFVASLRAALPNGWSCLWLDFTRVPDEAAKRPIASEIASRLVPQIPDAKHAIWEGLRVEEAASLIAGCDALVAMRLHGVMLGHLANLPVVALEYDRKVRALDDELEVPATQRMPLAAIPERLPAAIHRVTEGRSSAFRTDPARRAELAQRANAHRDLLWQTMRDPRVTWNASPTSYLPAWMQRMDDDARIRIDNVLRRCARARNEALCA